jgi:hypothetical protein
VSRACAIVSVVAGFAFAIGASCDRTSSSGPSPSASPNPTTSAPPTPTTNASPGPSPSPTPTIAQAPAPCAVAYVAYPSDVPGPNPGDDLSTVAVPFRVPDRASLTIALRRTGHEVTVQGPAVVRPCTKDDPDVILVASGHVSTNETSPVRPGTEIFIATPSLVAVVARASLDLAVSASKTDWLNSSGEVTITTLDTTKIPGKGEHGTQKRFSDGGLLLTRCGVQATATASAEHLLAAMGTDAGADAPAPLPSASIGVLAAEEIKHARERILDCAFVEAFALSCDVVAKEGTAKEKSESGCKGGYSDVQAYLAKAVASATLPPGSAAPSVSAVPSGK